LRLTQREQRQLRELERRRDELRIRQENIIGELNAIDAKIVALYAKLNAPTRPHRSAEAEAFRAKFLEN
jgi:hypothetical protein